jgi:hypothetical protein
MASLPWASPDAIIRHCPVFNPPPAAAAMRKTSAYAKLEQTNDERPRLRRAGMSA